MTDIIHEIVDAVKVHIVKDDTKHDHPQKPKQPKEIIATYRQFTVSNTTEPVMILGHAPNRTRAIVQITNGGPVAIGASRAAVVAQNSDVAEWVVAANGPVTMYTTKEVWAQNTVAGFSNIAVIAEYEER